MVTNICSSRAVAAIERKLSIDSRLATGIPPYTNRAEHLGEISHEQEPANKKN